MRAGDVRTRGEPMRAALAAEAVAAAVRRSCAGWLLLLRRAAALCRLPIAPFRASEVGDPIKGDPISGPSSSLLCMEELIDLGFTRRGGVGGTKNVERRGDRMCGAPGACHLYPVNVPPLCRHWWATRKWTLGAGSNGEAAHSQSRWTRWTAAASPKGWLCCCPICCPCTCHSRSRGGRRRDDESSKCEL